MNADILSIDPIIIEELPEELTTFPIIEDGTMSPEIPLSFTSRFGSIDIWKIRSVRRHFTAHYLEAPAGLKIFFLVI